ncbi:uncharacterized protein LOC142332960 [Lycorma delicatula]|uniref:uncharacterized protein LOC142332960 n=1 Tax=Lycorma delicatula TaxID=130591 RepID=UPI003F50E8CA
MLSNIKIYYLLIATLLPNSIKSKDVDGLRLHDYIKIPSPTENKVELFNEDKTANNDDEYDLHLIPEKGFNITYLIENALEKIKILMREGNETLYIKKLDPYVFNESVLSHGDAIMLDGELHGQLINLSNFTWDGFYACLFSLTLQLNLIIPYIELNGYYDLNGSAYNTFPLYGSGNYSFIVENLNFTLTTQFTPQRGDKPLKLNLTAINLNDYSNIKLNFGEIFGGGSLSEIFNNFTNDILSAVIYRIVGLLENLFSHTVKYIIIENSYNITVTQLIDYLKEYPHE